jgi:hypothetical protein
LTPGTYTLTPAPSGTLTPDSPTYTVTITAGQNTPVTVNYVPSTGGGSCTPVTCPQPLTGCTVPANCPDIGTLELHVSGLLGTPGAASLIGTGPTNGGLTLTNGVITVPNLAIGAYTLNVQPVGTLYPGATVVQFNISKDTTQIVYVAYTGGGAAREGKITLTVKGLPATSSANVNVSGQITVSMDQQNTTKLITQIAAPVGSYTINAPAAVNVDGVNQVPTINGSPTFVLADGQIQNVVIDYSSNPNQNSGTTGLLTVMLVGLPYPSPAVISVTGPMTITMDSQTTNRYVSIPNAPLGEYTVNVQPAYNQWGAYMYPIIRGVTNAVETFQGPTTGHTFVLTDGLTRNIVIDYTTYCLRPTPGGGGGTEYQYDPADCLGQTVYP